ncbi:MAG: hypothetical protein FWC50_02845 [Planctomycetaceae bacterium]|nr:hypothetical protein [Planctomycetaceae bacterium]
MHFKRFLNVLLTLSVSLGGILALSANSFAQETDSSPGILVSQSEAVTEQTVPATPSAGETAGDMAGETKPKTVIEKEQTVYVPYEKLKNTFETEGRGVFLPYAEFRKLWDAAHRSTENATKPEPIKAPIAAMITETENIAKINGDLVEVTATIRFDLLESGWHRLPLQLQQAAITEATISGEPALIEKNQDGYTLLAERKKDAPVRGELTLKYAKTYEKSPGRNSVMFNVPQAPLSRWEFRVPDTGVKVDFQPMIAAGELPVEEGSKETVFRAFAGSAPNVQIGWTPKAEGATGLETLANVQTQQRMTIEEGVVRNRVQLNYAISRAQLEKLAIEVPGDQKIAGVLDANVRSWSISRRENVQIINVELFEPAKTTQSLLIEMEKFVPVADTFSVSVPQIKVIGVGGHQGILAVDASPGLACEQKKSSGLIQIDPGELPQALRIRAGGFAYRLSAPAYELELGIEKEQPRIFARSQVQVTIGTNAENITMINAYRIERAGVFQLFYDIPAEMNVRTVQPFQGINLQNGFGNTAGSVANNPMYPATGNQANAAPPVPPNVPAISNVAIDGWQLSDLPAEEGKPKMKRLTVNLARKAIGIVGVQIMLDTSEKKWDALQQNTEKAVDISIVSPTVAPNGIEQKEGVLILTAPESLRVTPTGFTGMQNVSFDQLNDKWVTNSPQRGNLAYVFASERPTLALQVMRRMPQTTVKQLQTVRIEDGVARFNDKIAYNILYSGIKSLRIDVPKEISEYVRNQTSEFRDTIITPQPDDVAEGCVAWNFERGTELTGDGVITLAWEKQIPQLLEGKSVEISIPRLVPHNVFRSWGQILLTKTETVDLSSTNTDKGLRQIDPQHDVDANDRVADAAYAFEYHDDWELSLTATRYELHEVKRASIEYGVLRVVLTRANTQSVQALFRIRSVKQRLPVVLPEFCSFDVEPRINGVPVTLETDATGQFLIPLTSTTPDKPFVLELRYTRKTPDTQAERKKYSIREVIAMPRFPDNPAVQHVYAAVYVPDEYALVSWQGNCSKNFEMTATGDKNKIGTINTPNIDGLMQGLPKEANAVVKWQDFPVDGMPYLFSVIQPDRENGDLFVVKLKKTGVINIFLFVVLAGCGFGLTYCRWRVRGIVVFGIIALYAVLAFAAPTLMFVVGVMSGVSWAIGLTIVIWVVWGFLRGWDKIKTVMTTPIPFKKTNAANEQPTVVVEEIKPGNMEGGSHA